MKTVKNSIQINYFYFLRTINSLICRIFFPVDCVNQGQGKRLQGNYSSWVSFLEEQRSTFYIVKVYFPCLKTYLESNWAQNIELQL